MSAEKSESTKAPMSNQKKIIIAVVVAVVLLNILWTLMQNKVAAKVDVLMGDIAKLEQRLDKLEVVGGPDIEALREEFGGMKKISDSYKTQLDETIKAEEARLSSLITELEDQKARVESLKAIVAPAD